MLVPMPELERPARRPRFSRRDALLATLASAPFGCRRPSLGSAPGGGGGGGPAWGGLKVARVSGMREDERGGHAVVVLHGWGAPGDDLVPLAEALGRPGVRFFIPAGPLPEMGGGRAWWHLDPHARPPHADSDRVPAGFRPTAEVVAARAAVQALLATVVASYAPATVSMVGFSQGAMLSIDVALAGAPAIDQVVAMSGVLLADSVPALNEARAAKPRFLLSHGRQDPVVPFPSGAKARELLEQHGFSVTWRPFDGGHQIPGPLLGDVERFLFASG
jgi:phospholipase/carboxylesterase